MDDKEDHIDIEPLLPHYDAVLYLVQYDKVSVSVGRSFPFAAVTKQYFRATIG